MVGTTTGPRRRALRAAGAALRRSGGRGLPALARSLPYLLFGTVLLLPVAGFLLVAVTPRTFSQGDSWFSLDAFRQAFTGWTAHALLDTCLVGVAAAGLATAIATALAWLTEPTTVAGRGLCRLLLSALLPPPPYFCSSSSTRLP